MYAGPPTSSISPARPSSSFSVTRSIASPRSTSLTILSKMRRCASRKKSAASMTSAAMLNASLWRRIAPRTERSASRLCGSVRSATPSAISGALGALGHHFHGNRDRHLPVQLHRDFHLADLLDRLGELQLALVDVEALRVQRFDDIGGSDRAVQRVGLAHFPANDHFHAGQPLGDGIDDAFLVGFLGVEFGTFAFDLFLVALGDQQR